MTTLVTGGAGFIGSALVRQLIDDTDERVVNVDVLTYAGNMESLGPARSDARHRFARVDITDAAALRRLFEVHQPDRVFHLAAESHVDRSIDGPATFVRTNVLGTYTLLEETLRYWKPLSAGTAAAFRFVHVSTDEVYGSLGASGLFSEDTPLRPEFARTRPARRARITSCGRGTAPTVSPSCVTNCSNNYGPYQFPEKLIPLVIHKALAGERLPVYGRGENVRDWLYVDDHVRALRLVAAKGTPGRTYNVGGGNERRNIDVVRLICRLLDELRPDPRGPHEQLITFVADRPGHDARYAIDASRLRGELGWMPVEDFSSGLRRTVTWYLDHPSGPPG